MAELILKDLNNPDKIIGLLHKDGTYYERGENQGFQEWPGSWEPVSKRERRIFYFLRDRRIA